MKYVISWRERPAASFSDYEAAQERVLKIFDKDWKMPASFSASIRGRESATTAAYVTE